MNHAYLKICRLLAASGFRERDLDDFVNQILLSGPDAVLSTILDLRQMDLSSSADRFLGDIPADRLLSSASDAAMKIERLLLNEAGMPKAAAIEIMTQELRQRFPAQEIPSESRKGFSNWIHRLSQQISEKDLLFVATAIRNRVVHDAPIDWRLK